MIIKYKILAFPYCVPKQWNSLPSNIRHIQSSDAFKTALKIYFYKQLISNFVFFQTTKCQTAWSMKEKNNTREMKSFDFTHDLISEGKNWYPPWNKVVLSV